MAPECERCGESLAGKDGGILARLGMKSYDGYECPNCGSLLCDACYRERQRQLVGTAPDTCPVCDSLLEHR